jgi:PDZ domain
LKTRSKENPNESSFHDVVHTGRLNVNLGGNGFGGSKRQIEKPKQAGYPDFQSGNNPYTTKPRPLVAVESSGASARASASPEELDILRERIKNAEEQFKYIDEQRRIGGKAGSKDRYEIAAYELALAQANLATAEGKREETIAKLVDAQAHAEEAFKAVSSAYDSGRVSYDLIRNEANRLAEIKLKVARLKGEKSPARASSDPDAGSGKPVAKPEQNQPPLPKRDATASPLGTVVVPNVEQVKVGRGGVTITPAEAVFVAYDIPPDLKNTVLQYFGRTEVHSMDDDRGRYIVQASRNWHEHFAALLKATPKWSDPAAAKERAAAPVVKKKVGDKDILEWRSVGLSLKRNTETNLYKPVSQTGVAVTEVASGSPAAWADIRSGDVLTDVGSFHAGNMPEVQSLLKALGEGLQTKKRVSVRFVRNNSEGMAYVTAEFTLGPEDLGAQSVEPQISKPSMGPQPLPTAIDNTNFRYDGKTLDDWRKIWWVDSNDKVKALEALEAFAAGGLEREANWEILRGVYSNSIDVARLTRKYLSTLSKSQATPIVNELLKVLKSDLSPNRRVQALRAIAAIGPNSEPALEELKTTLASKIPQERIAAATAIKRIVGKDQYQKPIADVLGDELGITVAKTANGKWGVLPRDDKVDVTVFNKFTEDVIKEQELLFPPDDNKSSK